MKLTKSTYFSLLFLFCFLASLSASAYRNLHASVSASDLQHKHTLAFSSNDNNSVSDTEFLFEENENETENDFHVQSFILPFFISFFQYEVLKPYSVSAKPLAESLSNPIYISVCNFRI